MPHAAPSAPLAAHPSVRPADRVVDRLVRRVYAGRHLHHSQNPSLRDLARELCCTQQQILDLVADNEAIEIVAGVATASGAGAFAQGDWKLDWVGDDVAPARRAR